jgi:cell division protein FtsA
MHNGKIIVGLDIGTTKVCAIVGRYNEYGKMMFWEWAKPILMALHAV